MEPPLPLPRSDVSRLPQAPGRRNFCASWRACYGSCTAQTERSAAETAQQLCGSPARAYACCVSPGRALQAEVGEATASRGAGSAH